MNEPIHADAVDHSHGGLAAPGASANTTDEATQPSMPKEGDYEYDFGITAHECEVEAVLRAYLCILTTKQSTGLFSCDDNSLCLIAVMHVIDGVRRQLDREDIHKPLSEAREVLANALEARGVDSDWQWASVESRRQFGHYCAYDDLRRELKGRAAAIAVTSPQYMSDMAAMAADATDDDSWDSIE